MKRFWTKYFLLIIGVILLIELVVASIVGVNLDDKTTRNEQNDCVSSGGKVVEIHNSSEWFCDDDT